GLTVRACYRDRLLTRRASLGGADIADIRLRRRAGENALLVLSGGPAAGREAHTILHAGVGRECVGGGSVVRSHGTVGISRAELRALRKVGGGVISCRRRHLIRDEEHFEPRRGVLRGRAASERDPQYH